MTVPVTVRTHNFLERLFYHFAALHLFLSVMFVDLKEGDSRVCGHGQFFLRYSVILISKCNVAFLMVLIIILLVLGVFGAFSSFRLDLAFMVMVNCNIPYVTSCNY